MMNYKRPPGNQIIDAYIDASATFGEDTVIWWYARILQQVKLGNHVMIGGGTEIGRGSVIGDYTRVGANVFLPPNSRLGEWVFVGPGVTCTDDRHPYVLGADDPPYHAEPPIIDDYASIGAGAVLLPGVHIGHHARVAAGAIVTKDVAPGTMVRGEPARLRSMPARWAKVG